MNPIAEPTLLLDEHIVRQNIYRMAQKAAANNLELKPHFKTHQSLTIGQWFRDYGVDKITVSSVKMAEYFADAGWNDITIAFPFNPLVSDRLNKLAREISLGILMSDVDSLPHLTERISEKVNIYIEIDTGSNRTGFAPSQMDQIERLIHQISEHDQLHLSGFYSHPGHSYRCRSVGEIKTVHQDAVNKMKKLKQRFSAQFPDIKTCIGDTPCCSVGQNFKGIDEMSPGNFVFYDLMQSRIGSCTASDIGIALACPVVATYPKRNEVIIHGGAIHLSKETLADDSKTHFGQCVPINDDLSWGDPITGCYVKSVSQEHGIISGTQSFVDDISIGDSIGILPIHSCLTADCMKRYITTQKTDQIDHLQGVNNN